MKPSRNKILHIIKGLDIGGESGGAEKICLDLAAAQKKQGWNVSVCVFFRMNTDAEAEWISKLNTQGIPCFFVSDWKGNNHFGSYWMGLRNLYTRIKPDPNWIGHSHFQLGTIAVIMMKGLGLVRYALRTCHISREWESGWYGWAREQILSKWIFPILLDKEVGVSLAIVNRLDSYPGSRLLNRKAMVVYNAATISPREAGYDPNREKKVVGVIGRLSEQKGHRFLIDAVPIILSTCSNVEFWLVGDGDLFEDLKERVNFLGVSDAVLFLGRRNDVAQILENLDLVVLPSLWEGLPVSVIESFIKQVPVVATDIPGTRELIRHGETGWLVPSGNAQALAEAVISALMDENARLKIHHNLEGEALKFSINKMANQYDDLYSSFDARRNGG